MKKVIKTIDEARKICQITIEDERFYSKMQPVTNEIKYFPSVTWITDSYPKGIAYHKWLAQKGWDEAEAIKIAAGDKGSKVHTAIGDLLDGKVVTMESKYLNNDTEEMEVLTLEEYECLLSFITWHKKFNPKTIAREIVVFDDQYDYAGTLDYLCVLTLKVKKEIVKQIWIIDFKTSQNIWPSHELQVSAYKKALIEELLKQDKEQRLFLSIPPETEIQLGILQLGYRRNGDRYKFTKIEDKFDLFLSAQNIWKHEHGAEVPKKMEYPTELMLEEKEEKKKEKEEKKEEKSDDTTQKTQTGL